MTSRISYINSDQIYNLCEYWYDRLIQAEKDRDKIYRQHNIECDESIESEINDMKFRFSIYNNIFHDATGDFWKKGLCRGYIVPIDEEDEPQKHTIATEYDKEIYNLTMLIKDNAERIKDLRKDPYNDWYKDDVMEIWNKLKTEREELRRRYRKLNELYRQKTGYYWEQMEHFQIEEV